ncbi:GAF domain-containing protein [Paenibacillus sp. YPG26]|uniref:GAF domain-containing protein n=1 Tax=Paenibacillus sp. YPG26 TaxID=2878915 RepID=UPI00203CA7F4|nr:GAF domain-containing protein [Paenibacillus sp. YPG26]USB32659.1 GAF domain-containing protein [Paenibacillus sp. YPG26]
MITILDHIEQELDSLRARTGSDFSGLLLMDNPDTGLRWNFVSGNRSKRSKQIILRPGQGLPGLVMRLGRRVVLDESLPDIRQLRFDNPIMLAENLHAVAVIPIVKEREILGLVMIGNRKPTLYPPEIIEVVEQEAELLSPVIYGQKSGTLTSR